VREIGNDGSVDRHGVDLSESTEAIVGGHCNADLQSHRPGPTEFLTRDSEPVGSLDQPVVAGISILCKTSLQSDEPQSDEHGQPAKGCVLSRPRTRAHSNSPT
jgi:hypothetical protein